MTDRPASQPHETPGFGRHGESHRSGRSGWLRAAVLGANDGIVSTASLMVGVASAAASSSAVLTAGIAGLVAGSMSMAAGEYVSVSSQSDAEQADLRIEARELADDPEGERDELAAIYHQRGVPLELAVQVADALMETDPLRAHAIDELGITDQTAARPVQAAWASAASFVTGGILPIIALLVAPAHLRLVALIAATLIALAGLGAAGARTGGAPLRVLVGGAAAMAVTALIGALVGVSGV